MTVWYVDKRPRFKKQYKEIGQDRQANTDKAIRELVKLENPALVSRYKKNIGAFVYDLGRGDRLMYTLDYAHDTIILHRVCDHKSVYGKD